MSLLDCVQYRWSECLYYYLQWGVHGIFGVSETEYATQNRRNQRLDHLEQHDLHFRTIEQYVRELLVV